MLRLSVCLLWPGAMDPTVLISGQSGCAGCGSLNISRGGRLLFTKVTCVPALTTRPFGLTPLDVMVIVVFGGGVPPPEGDVPPPPHAAASPIAPAAARPQ